MRLQHQTIITQYNTLLQNLNPLGRYQILTYAICTVYWMFAGIYRTTLDIGFSNLKCSYLYAVFEGIGLLIFSYTSNEKGCKNGILIAGIISLFGCVLIIYPILQSRILQLQAIGLGMIRLSVSVQPALIISIISQLATPRIIQIVFCLSIMMHNIGRIVAAILYDRFRQQQKLDKNLFIYILIPCCIISFLLSFPINDSPRFIIQNKYNQAQQLIDSILTKNGIGGEKSQVMKNIDQNFLIKRVHLRKYNFITLFKYNSLKFPQYCKAIIMFCLGIISRSFAFIFQQKTIIVPIDIQIIWTDLFQMIGILSSMFFLAFCQRRSTCMFMSFLAALVVTILYFIYNNSLDNDLILLALNAAFLIILYIFLVINVIQFYPHSIRTLGIGFIMFFYCFGQLFFSVYLITLPNTQIVVQLFLWGSWIMFLHSCFLKETLKKGLSYEIQEIQQEENQQV